MNKHPWLSEKKWAVVGASTNPSSYGNRITASLMKHGYEVVPVSPKYPEVEGLPTVSSIRDYKGEIDVVDFVVNPQIGLSIMDEVIEAGIKKVLLQPGTASDELIDKARGSGIEVIQSCVLVLLAWED